MTGLHYITCRLPGKNNINRKTETMFTIYCSRHAEEMIKLLNSVEFEYSWIFCKGIDKSQKDDIKFRKYLKRSFKKTFYFEDRKSIKNINNY